MHAEVNQQWNDYDEPKPFFKCDCEGCNIYEGDYYYDVNGYIVCEDCKIKYINRFRRVANE